MQRNNMRYFGIDIPESEFITMEEFALKWRFTDEKFNLLPKVDLATISPLKTEIANNLMSVADNYIFNSSLKGNYDFFHTDLDVIETSKVKTWLFGKQQKSNKQVLVLYTFTPTALMCTWDIFVKYWDDFCYPSSDNVLISPMDKKWLFFYSHEEIFQYKQIIKE